MPSPAPYPARSQSAASIATVIRNGSRGMFWMEPLVEVETPRGRIAYGPVSSDPVPGLCDAGVLEGKPHALCLGVTDEIDWLKRQSA